MVRITTSQKDRRNGFTIVELLIVIVVIAILAAITLVAYNGMQDRAKATQVAQVTDRYTKALGLYALDYTALPLPATSGSIGCFDGTVNCNGAATLGNSTTLLNGVKQYITNAPLSLSYGTTLLAYNSTADTSTGGTYTGYYLLFTIPSTQSCPGSVSGARLLNTSTSGTIRSCRIAINTP